jgi:NAD(P)-dependent dehydrogenase (short-subunit alcohol dehydrogenase family)
MAVITGANSEFGRLVAEEFARRADRVTAVLDFASAAAADHSSPEATRPNPTDSGTCPRGEEIPDA